MTTTDSTPTQPPQPSLGDIRLEVVKLVAERDALKAKLETTVDLYVVGCKRRDELLQACMAALRDLERLVLYDPADCTTTIEALRAAIANDGGK